MTFVGIALAVLGLACGCLVWVSWLLYLRNRVLERERDQVARFAMELIPQEPRPQVTTKRVTPEGFLDLGDGQLRWRDGRPLTQVELEEAGLV